MIFCKIIKAFEAGLTVIKVRKAIYIIKIMIFLLNIILAKKFY